MRRRLGRKIGYRSAGYGETGVSWVTVATKFDQAPTIASVDKKTWTILHDSGRNNTLKSRKGGGLWVLKIEALRRVETSVAQKHRLLSHKIRVLLHHHFYNISSFNNFHALPYIAYPATGDPCDNLKVRTEISKVFTFLPSSGTHQRLQIQGDGHVAPPRRQQAVP